MQDEDEKMDASAAHGSTPGSASGLTPAERSRGVDEQNKTDLEQSISAQKDSAQKQGSNRNTEEDDDE